MATAETFGGMKTRISRELNRSNIPDDTLEDTIFDAIKHYKARRFVFNTSVDVTATASSGTPILTISAHSVIELDEVIFIQSSSRERLQPRPLQYLQGLRTTPSYKGPPSFYNLINGKEMLTDVIIDQSYTFELSYLHELSAVSADGDTNAWFSDGNELIRTHAKRKLLENWVRGTDARAEAAALAQEEMVIYRELRRQYNQRVTTGRQVPYQYTRRGY